MIETHPGHARNRALRPHSVIGLVLQPSGPPGARSVGLTIVVAMPSLQSSAVACVSVHSSMHAQRLVAFSPPNDTTRFAKSSLTVVISFMTSPLLD